MIDGIQLSINLSICRHASFVFSLISLPFDMDTHITYKLQHSLRVSKFIMHTLFCLLTTQNVDELDVVGFGAGKPQNVKGNVCLDRVHAGIRIQD